jgi:uncharacterized protein YcbX
MPTGAITELWRYPVKSMAGEPVRSMRVDWRGAGGDRTHALLYDHKGARKHLTAREAPAMLAWSAAYPLAPDAVLDPAEPPPVTVTAPDGSELSWQDPRLRRGLVEALGREVELQRDVEGQQDIGRTLLVTTEATRAALEAELGRPLDLRRFRPNLHLQTDAPAWAEHGWEGRRMRIEGGVVLELLAPCERCAIPNRDPDTQEKWPELLRHITAQHEMLFGINARVMTAGRVEVGQTVEIA